MRQKYVQRNKTQNILSKKYKFRIQRTVTYGVEAWKFNDNLQAQWLATNMDF